jgi:hypothetical protein
MVGRLLPLACVLVLKLKKMNVIFQSPRDDDSREIVMVIFILVKLLVVGNWQCGRAVQQH